MNSPIKLFTFSLLLSWSCATASRHSTNFQPVPLLPHPSSALLAADTLRSRGYSIFASLLISVTSTTNFSGTLLAPPDSTFSFASTKIRNHRPPPRPSIPVLLYHTLSPPLILTWPTLSARDDGDELRTFYNNFCLYVFKTSLAREVSISSSPLNSQISAVKIRQPDLYVDDHLTVHGIDGVLNPLFGTRCSATYSDPTADGVPLQVNRVFLDYAMRALRRKGFQVVAAAMSIRISELLPLTSVTVLAVSDEHLFMTPGGFHYDFRHHVVRKRQRYADLAKMMAAPTQFSTLAPNKTVLVVSNDGAVTVDGIPVGMREIYHNRWIVVISVTSSLDDVAGSRQNPPTSDDSIRSPAPIPGVSTEGKSLGVPSPAPIYRNTGKGNSPRVPSPSPAYAEEFKNGNPSLSSEAADAPTDSDWVGTPSPAADLDEDDNVPSNKSPARSPSPAPETEDAENPVSSPVHGPARDVFRWDPDVVISKGIEGWDLLFPDGHLRQLREAGSSSADDVEFDAHRHNAEDLTQSTEVKIAQHVNIADDVFFYI